jgi:hypothetical protein
VPFQAVPAGIFGVFPGRDVPAPCQARCGYAQTGQFVVILQWARIVTESQSSTATSENLLAAQLYPENITRARPKSDGRARINTAGFSRAFHTRDFFSDLAASFCGYSAEDLQRICGGYAPICEFAARVHMRRNGEKRGGG